jgi:hypothetical protein
MAGLSVESLIDHLAYCLDDIGFFQAGVHCLGQLPLRLDVGGQLSQMGDLCTSPLLQ